MDITTIVTSDCNTRSIC